jgi:hypothetical protein
VCYEWDLSYHYHSVYPEHSILTHALYFIQFQVMEGLNKMRAEFEHSLGDINDPNRPANKMGWFDWMEMDLEEHAARKKREKERNVLDSLPKHMRVPSRYATSFFPTLFLGVLVTFHALVLLLQYWSVAFHTWINYQEVQAENVHLPDDMLEIQVDLEKDKKVDKFLGNFNLNLPEELPTHVRIVPAKGPHLLTPIDYYPVMGMTFEYHRRRYVYDFEEKAWIKIRCRTDIPLSFLDTWKGFKDNDQAYLASLRYGPNAFEIKQPTFGEMYKKQLLSPFTVFQLFCVILWMLDDYWQYSAFTLFMILTFEATVVFSRLKSWEIRIDPFGCFVSADGFRSIQTSCYPEICFPSLESSLTIPKMTRRSVV